MDESTITEARAKIEATLDGQYAQSGAELLTWGCALVAARVPEPESPYAFDPAVIQGQDEPAQLDLLPWDHDQTMPPDWEDDILTEPAMAAAEPAQPAPLPPGNPLPLGIPTLEEHVRWGWQLITHGGEQLWLTPVHLLAIEHAGAKLYGMERWIPTLGFRSSPTPYEPVSDFYVVRTCAPPKRLDPTAYYASQEYHHASRSHQHIVLAFKAKPAGLPW